MIRIISGSLGDDHVELADVLYNMGLIKSQLGEKENARKNWNRGLEIVTDKLGASHPKYNAFNVAISGL
jgi:Tfp pilus assembly protein PilF